jgi:hypothetical protein
MFVASDWIDINRLAGDSIISDQSDGYENGRIDGLDSPECGIHSKIGDVSESTRMRNAIEEDKEPAMSRLNSFRPNAVLGCGRNKVHAR